MVGYFNIEIIRNNRNKTDLTRYCTDKTRTVLMNSFNLSYKY